MAITIYGTPDCFGCTKTAEKFEEAGITPDRVDLSQDKATTERLKAAGYGQAPIVIQVINGDQKSQWSGLNPTKIADAIAVELEAGR